MYTTLVSITSLEIILNFIIVLAVFVLVLAIVIVRRLAQMKKAIADLQQENGQLQAALAHTKDDVLATAAPIVERSPAGPLPDVADAVASVEEQPAVSAPSEAPAAVDGPEPEVVAAIVAALASCGYGPDSIRSIKPHRQRSTGWIMAGRIASMR
jgi:hypothetical protein